MSQVSPRAAPHRPRRRAVTVDRRINRLTTSGRPLRSTLRTKAAPEAQTAGRSPVESMHPARRGPFGLFGHEGRRPVGDRESGGDAEQRLEVGLVGDPALLEPGPHRRIRVEDRVGGTAVERQPLRTAPEPPPPHHAGTPTQADHPGVVSVDSTRSPRGDDAPRPSFIAPPMARCARSRARAGHQAPAVPAACQVPVRLEVAPAEAQAGRELVGAHERVRSRTSPRRAPSHCRFGGRPVLAREEHEPVGVELLDGVAQQASRGFDHRPFAPAHGRALDEVEGLRRVARPRQAGRLGVVVHDHLGGGAQRHDPLCQLLDVRSSLCVSSR